MRRWRGVMPEQRDHCRVERGEKGGDAVTLRQEITLRVGRSDGKIGGLVDDRAHTGPDHRVEHLFAERDDGVLDDLDREDVVLHCPAPQAARWMRSEERRVGKEWVRPCE